MVSVSVDLTLECCQHTQQEIFDSVDVPYLDHGIYRKNVVCNSCGTLVIVDCRTNSGKTETEQEIIKL